MSAGPPAAPPTSGGPAVKQQSFSTVPPGKLSRGQKVVLYGPGGVGKTSLAANLGKAGVVPLLIDADDGCVFLDASKVGGVNSWDTLLSALNDKPLWEGVGAVVLDSLTALEEWATLWTLENVKDDRSKKVERIEDYGFGKGLTHVYETFIRLFPFLDSHAKAGRHVICIAHECTTTVNNPDGEDYACYQPRLQSPNSGKSSIRHRVKEWADHLLHVGYDVNAAKGKAQGQGTRTIRCVERPGYWAKSRTLSDSIPYPKDSVDLWKQLFRS